MYAFIIDSNQSGWCMSVSLKGCNFEHTELSGHLSMMMCNHERSPGCKSVESGIKTNVC